MEFLNDDFLLSNEFARRLYNGHAKDLPIIDYHCHLSPADIAENRVFSNLTQAWLEGDHYKWRAMRTLGIDERFITGNATDAEKFEKWAYAIPYTVRNPLFHWTHLELRRYFGIRDLLSPSTSSSVYASANEQLRTPGHSTQGLLNRMKVEVVGTTDDPIDSLTFHQQIRKQNIGTQILPTFRPDKAYAIENVVVYNDYLQKLSVVSETPIASFSNLLQALEKRMDYFHANGCRLADHGLEQLHEPVANETPSIEHLFSRLLKKESLTKNEGAYFKHTLLLELCRMYHQRGWVQQFHVGAMRNTNDRMMAKLGADSGFDSIGDYPQAQSTARFLNALDRTNQLAKTILYNLNPSANEVMAAMLGNFNDGSIKGKIQFGSAWWFLDQKDGMEKQLNALSNLGLISCFIGMITDSRSFLSYPRHEYFRRILCNLIGKDVANGELPSDEVWLGKIVADVCYHNAKHYFF